MKAWLIRNFTSWHCSPGHVQKGFFFFFPQSHSRRCILFDWLTICPRTWSFADSRWTSKFISKKWKLVGCYDLKSHRLEKFIPQTCVISRISCMIIQDGGVFMGEMHGEMDWLLQKYKDPFLGGWCIMLQPLYKVWGGQEYSSDGLFLENVIVLFDLVGTN